MAMGQFRSHTTLQSFIQCSQGLLISQFLQYILQDAYSCLIFPDPPLQHVRYCRWPSFHISFAEAEFICDRNRLIPKGVPDLLKKGIGQQASIGPSHPDLDWRRQRPSHAGIQTGGNGI